MSCEHELSWADRKFGCFECGKRKGPYTRFRFTQRPNYEDYRGDLARFPGDPEAKVNSPEQVRKLRDKRLRQGWIDRGPLEFKEPPTSQGDSYQIAEQAYLAAKAKGFRTDG